MKQTAVLIALILMACVISAQTVIPPGPVQGSWDQTGSPYQITGDISIVSGTSLTIGPGVSVEFQGAFSIAVSGSITTNGTSVSPVVFTAQDTLAGWSSIRLSNTGTGINPGSVFNGTHFLYGRAIWGSGGQDPLNFGGAVWADNAGLITFNDCYFFRCKSIQDGSAVYAKNNSRIAMSDCTIKNCESGFFGGVFVKDGTVSINRCLFDSNTAVTFGAGLYIYDCTMADIRSSRITNNTAGAVTGIYSAGSPLEVRSSLFASNSTTTGLGAGIGVIWGSATLINCTFYDNYSPQGGAAVWFNSLPEPAQVTNCIFWMNMVAPIQATSTTYTLSYCSTQASDGDATNIHGDPLFLNPGIVDLRLADNSPCIDAGTPDASALGLPDQDLGGQPRFVDGNNDSVARIDIGCYEWQLPPSDGLIEGIVTDAQNQPLSGALVTINGVSVATNGAGFYSYTIEPGTYNVTCSHDGFAPQTVNGVVVQPGMTTTLNFVLDAVDNDDPSAPELQTCLLGNYPNPFVTGTAIRYQLAGQGPVSIRLYNLKGQLVRILLDTQQVSGIHSLVFDGLDADGNPLARGVYLYRITTPGYQGARRMLLK